MLAVHERQLAEHGGPEGVRDMGLLESALARPQNAYAYGETDLSALAAKYAAGIIQNHPFVDGNKRTGYLAAELFLALNGHHLMASDEECLASTLLLAAGELSEDEYAAWLRENSEEES